MNVAPGSTSVWLIVKVVDDNQLPVTGLTAATFPPTYYVRTGLAAVSITLSDLASPSAAWSSGGVAEIGGGRYRLDVPNAAFNVTAYMVEIFGEASGKHIVAPQITNQWMKSDVRLWMGSGPAGLLSGLLQVHDHENIFSSSGMTYGASTIEWGAESGDYSFLVGTLAEVTVSGLWQRRLITGFTFETGIMTVDVPWTNVPAADDQVNFYAAAALNADQRNAIADHVKRRSQANTEASNYGDTLHKQSLYGLVQHTQESNAVDNPGQITIYKTNGTTELGRLNQSTDENAEPTTGVS